MHIQTLSIFPELIESALSQGIPSRAKDRGLVMLEHHDLRTYTTDKHHKVDDSPYGGGAGMVFKPEPVIRAVRALKKPETLVVHFSPAAPKLTQAKVKALADTADLLLIASRYEGLDQRVVEAVVDEEFAIGEFVYSGGELACAMVIDAVIRLLPGALGKEESYQQDSFFSGLLDHPHYTRPADFEGYGVPDVLQSGNHEQIRLWRKKTALQRTLQFRPDLLETAELDEEAVAMLAMLRREDE